MKIAKSQLRQIIEEELRKEMYNPAELSYQDVKDVWEQAPHTGLGLDPLQPGQYDDLQHKLSTDISDVTNFESAGLWLARAVQQHAPHGYSPTDSQVIYDYIMGLRI